MKIPMKRRNYFVIYAAKRFAVFSSASLVDDETTLVCTLEAGLEIILTISAVFSTTGKTFDE